MELKRYMANPGHKTVMRKLACYIDGKARFSRKTHTVTDKRMPLGQGGTRRGAGRPAGSVAKKRQVTLDTIIETADGYLPLSYMLALMRDEQAEPSRRDAMAIQAAPYCHARLNAVATTNASGKGTSGDINIVQIFAVPRGAALDVKSGQVMIEGNQPVNLNEVQPYEGTPALRTEKGLSDTAPSQPDPVKTGPHAEPLPVYELDADNVTRLDTYRDKDTDTDPSR